MTIMKILVLIGLIARIRKFYFSARQLENEGSGNLVRAHI